MEARPPTQNRHGEAPRGERVPLDARRASQGTAVAPDKRDNEMLRRLGAPPPLGWGTDGKRKAKPGRSNAPRERRNFSCLTS